MRNVRVIARLDIKGKNVINTIHLEGLRTVGPPNDLAIAYYQAGVDELLIIDQVASLYQRSHLSDLTREFAKDIFVPLTVGGGIASVDDARTLLRSGADKIAINSAATRRPKLITELSQEFGAQCVVVSIQAKIISDSKWEVFTDGGRERTGLDVLEWSKAVVELGAGELLVTSIDRDGTRKGFDNALLSAVSSGVSVPVIASGGMGAPSHAVDMLQKSQCEAVSIADFFHASRGTVRDVKESASQAGFAVRLDG
jgi:imidazole glycerol-phosphate synthase subunit HisF